ncbi:MAG: polysaccharide biosynthesis/export family protein [Aquabacterium sp.]|uniref:polysaccharide biosynthesis/export family protein n=1 Tax=Aquabacterium sp. TaxID=1872578 RepID=UPI002727C605|nr:polysaccharide biosynthesis/export family protein [Aquabacterium sp.]MDO9005540.1 polysaccharide biosynthesis/export family protein [Aquabacterium sp.]
MNRLPFALPLTPLAAGLALLWLLVASLPAVADNADPFGINQVIGLNAPPGSATPTATTPATVVPATTSTPQMSTTATAVQAAPVPGITTQQPQYFDYSVNLKSDVFGANLFTGAFAREGATHFNPDYVVASGDNIQVRFWGAFEYDAPLTVDPQGNIFVPHVGPVHVLGVRNQDLQQVVNTAVSRVFRANVYSYASLAAAQPVRVFVSGFVNRPGLYSGTSMDSLLHYLDQAGGIDVERGSFLNVEVKRGPRTRATLSLYDFILQGRMPLIQLSDGDVIFVAPRLHTVKVNGLAGNAKRFEFSDEARSVADLMKVAKPQAQATHVRITRNTGTTKNVEYYPLSAAQQVSLQSGDDIEFTADKKPGTITVRVEGEHLSPQEYVIPYGTRLGKLMQHVRYSERADVNSLQLFRQSIAARQKEMLKTALKHLEAAVLTVRSGTAEESQLRKEEADLMLQWVDRAKNIEPSGQVMLAHADNINGLLLESGDIIRIPAIDNLVLVSGEVMFPNTIALAADKTVEDYIKSSGGYSQNADTSRIIIAHRDGSFEDTEENGGWFDADTVIRPGDEIMVLPKVDAKYRQLFKEVSTMLYQMALGARVILN